MTPRKPSPRQAATETLKRLRAGADAKRATSYQRWFKDPVNYFGLDKQEVTRIKQDLYDRIEGTWTIRDAVGFCEAMIRDPHMEARGIGYQVVAHFVHEAPPELIADVERWLEHACGNWGLVDNLAPSVLGPLLERHPRLVAEVVAWTGSPNPWLRRGAVVAFVPLVTRKKYLAPAYRIVSRLCGEKEDLVQKAIGWLLREAGKTDPERLETFLLAKGPDLPRTSVRYAIERFAADKRKDLLTATRRAGASPRMDAPRRLK